MPAVKLKIAALAFGVAGGLSALALGPVVSAERPTEEIAMNCADCEPEGPCTGDNCTGPWPW